MRGKQCAGTVPISLSGITPADAGKTSVCLHNVFFLEDHPRGCGENDFKLKSNRKEVGSPPRMRGKLTQTALTGHFPGITPADAGKTIQVGATLTFDKDHPRGCGENS